MVIKLLGGIFLLGGAMGLCINLLNRQRMHEIGLMNMRNSLLRVQQQVNELGIPVPDIILREIKRTNGYMREYYEAVWKEMEQEQEQTLEELLSQGWCVTQGIFSKEEEMLFQEALLLLFYQEQTGAKHTLDSYVKGIEDLVTEKRRGRRNQRKVTIAITMMTAAMVLCMLM